MDESPGDVKRETEQPQNEEDDDDGPDQANHECLPGFAFKRSDSFGIMLPLSVGGVNLAAVARTRAWRRFSTTGFAGMTAARWRWNPHTVLDEQPQLSTERHRLAEIVDKGARIAPPLAHPETHHHRMGVTRARQRLEEERTETFERELEAKPWRVR